MSATTINKIAQTETDILSLSSLADNTLSAAGSAVNNVYGTSNFQGYPRALLQLKLGTYTGTPTAGAALLFWFLKSLDGGTTYEDASNARQPDAIFPIESIASGPQVPGAQDVDLPVGYWKPIVKTSGVGVTLGTIDLWCAPYSFQGQ
ncbi:MAG: hypothetical protein KGL39_60265 [Patescibacteria group bacterium]|nr:hypothetical protein [Patescibacteria group bacterium]